MPQRDPERVLEALRGAAWPVLSSWFAHHRCCIGATKVGIEVLAKHGVHGKPLCTEAFVCNRVYREAIERHKTIDQADVDAGARCVAVDLIKSEDRGFNGHLVIVGKVRGKQFLLDLSAPQFHRPAKSIQVPEAIGCFTHEVGSASIPLDAGGTLIYTPHVNETWRTAPAWLPDEMVRQAYTRMVVEITDDMKANV